MDARAAKLALARKKLKDHQDKKLEPGPQNTIHVPYTQPNSESLVVIEDVAPTPVVENDCRNTNVAQDHLPCQTYVANPETVEPYDVQSTTSIEPRVNVTEILISNKRDLEAQVIELQSKVLQLESNLNAAVNSNNEYKQHINYLENELKTLRGKCVEVSEQLVSKERTINEFSTTQTALTDENNNLQEQLEFTKNILSTKDMEISSLNNQLFYMQNQLDATHLQLQQLTGSQTMLQNAKHDSQPSAEELLKKISTLEHQLKASQKERDQINSHYEHYMSELNEQLKSVMSKNEELNSEIQVLANRENSLIAQLSEMEIRLQNYRAQQVLQDPATVVNENNKEFEELQQKYDVIQAKLKSLSHEYEELQKKFAETDIKLKELSQEKEAECQDESRNITKLNADITSDKIAAQRATEQNKKLKHDIQELEEAFVKISQDKLELTEKVAAEKFLNRELTIKLAEFEEKANDMSVKLRAKDEEMMRLQASYRDIESKYEKLINSQTVTDTLDSKENEVMTSHDENCTGHDHKHDHHTESNGEGICEAKHECSHSTLEGENLKIPKEDAMSKLQQRFLKIMGDVADLSDEKHRLEHIILQLQNETDTICEYVALYQQQRNLLKKRDEERSAQVKIFQAECELLKKQLEELSNIIVRFTKDKELSVYFEDEAKYSEVRKVMDLLSNLKRNTLIDPMRQSSELKGFYPCGCCSGQLIEV